jgi:hypothetical protein
MSVVSSCPFWDETAYYFVGSFQGAGSAREPGTYEHRLGERLVSRCS